MSDDSVELAVIHKLASVHEIDNRKFSVIGDRIKKALLIKPDETPKGVRVARRALHARGKQARDKKPRRIR